MSNMVARGQHASNTCTVYGITVHVHGTSADPAPLLFELSVRSITILSVKASACSYSRPILSLTMPCWMNLHMHGKQTDERRA